MQAEITVMDEKDNYQKIWKQTSSASFIFPDEPFRNILWNIRYVIMLYFYHVLILRRYTSLADITI